MDNNTEVALFFLRLKAVIDLIEYYKGEKGSEHIIHVLTKEKDELEMKFDE